MGLATITADVFDDTVAAAGSPVLIDFWAPWCAPCRALAPILEDIADDYEGRVVVAKLNVEEAPEVASQYGVSTLPTLILFTMGLETSRLTGVASRMRIAELLDQSCG